MGSVSANAATALTITAAGAADLVTTGTVLYAYNLGFGTNSNGSDPSQTYTGTDAEGITFTNVNITGNHSTSTATIDLSAYAGDGADAINITTTMTGGSEHFGTFDSGTDLYQSFIYTNGSPSEQSINVNGLTASSTYLIQILQGDGRNVNADYDVFLGVDGGLTSDSLQNMTWGTTAGGNSVASITVSGQTDLQFSLQGSGTGISGVVVSEVVPEPSSAALLGLGGLALIMRRRK